jgi:hypothetical protein
MLEAGRDDRSRASPRLHPPHPQFDVELPESQTPWVEPLSSTADVNFVDDVCLEISRETSRLRGMMLAIGTIGCLFSAALVIVLLSEARNPFQHAAAAMTLMLVALLGLLCLSLALIRFELKLPRDEPVRFNRKTKKVYVNGIAHSNNPFTRVVHEIKVHDWANLHVERLRYLAFNGRFAVVRYGLDIAVCKSGTLEVQTRFWLVRNAMGMHVNSFESKWAYIRAFMQGADLTMLQKLSQPRSASPSLRASLRHHLPYLDTSESGRSWTKSAVGRFIVSLTVLATPLILPLALAHFFSLRFAPASAWPLPIDHESRSA